MKSFLKKTNVVVLAVVLVGILVLANVAMGEVPARYDLTDNKQFSLSKQTKQTLDHLKQPVHIYFFGGGQPQDEDIQTLLKQYEKASRHIELDMVDANENPSLAQKYGVQSYGTTVFESGEETKTVEPFSLFSQGNSPNSYNFMGEQQFTQAIIQVTKKDKTTVTFLQGHGEPDPNTAFNQAVQMMQGEAYEIETLNLATDGEITEKVGILAIAGPSQDLSEKETEQIDQYLQQDGQMIVFLQPTEDGKKLKNLHALLAKWGIEPQQNIVIDPKRSFFNDPLTPVPLFEPHDITADLEEGQRAVILAQASGMAAADVEGLTITPLLTTSDQAWGETDFATADAKKDEDDTDGPLTLAYAVEEAGKAEKDQDDETADDAKASEEQKAAPKLVAIGNVTILDSDLFMMQGNADFVLNSFHWLSGEEDNISIRPQEKTVEQITLTPGQADMIFLSTVAGLPLIILLSGGFVWWRRRHM